MKLYTFPFNFEQHEQITLTQQTLMHISNLVEKTCRSENNKFGYSVYKNHILLVADYAKKLAQQLGADEEVCEIAALLHDYASVLDYNLYENHHIHSAKLAHDLLNQLDYPKEKIEEIKHCIISHRASKSIPRKTIEAHILASADAIAHIMAWESLLDLALYEYQYPEDIAREWVSKKLERSYQKIMPQALPLIQDKYNMIQATLQNPQVIQAQEF